MLSWNPVFDGNVPFSASHVYTCRVKESTFCFGFVEHTLAFKVAVGGIRLSPGRPFFQEIKTLGSVFWISLVRRLQPPVRFVVSVLILCSTSQDICEEHL